MVRFTSVAIFALAIILGVAFILVFYGPDIGFKLGCSGVEPKHSYYESSDGSVTESWSQGFREVRHNRWFQNGVGWKDYWAFDAGGKTYGAWSIPTLQQFVEDAFVNGEITNEDKAWFDCVMGSI
jgi:hypothetical protein